MDFLKEILGDELFSQVEGKINAYNSDEANKDKQIKIANLASGEYISKNKFSDLEGEKGNIQTQLDAANKVIEELKKSNKGDETLQKKVSDYEAEIQTLKDELAETKVASALRVALLEANVTDVDYLAYKVREKGEVEIGDDGKIKGIDDTIAALKTQYPQHFDSKSSGKKINEKKLPNDDGDKGMTREEILAMPYTERNRLYQENPEQFNKIMKEGN